MPLLGVHSQKVSCLLAAWCSQWEYSPMYIIGSIGEFLACQLYYKPHDAAPNPKEILAFSKSSRGREKSKLIVFCRKRNLPASKESGEAKSKAGIACILNGVGELIATKGITQVDMPLPYFSTYSCRDRGILYVGSYLRQISLGCKL